MTRPDITPEQHIFTTALCTATRIFCRSERNDLAGRILDNLAKDIPFEAHWPASFQIQAIEAYQHWSKTQHTSFDPGRWYFAGRRMT
jgi:hypothetical protein